MAVERLQECARALVEEVSKLAKEAPTISAAETTLFVPTHLLRIKTGQLIAEAIVTSLNGESEVSTNP